MADLKVQKAIQACLEIYFPKLISIGEESAESLRSVPCEVDPAEIAPDFINMDLLHQQLGSRREFNKEMQRKLFGNEIRDEFVWFQASDNVHVWIDPLDGTKDFTMGNVNSVTVLVGLAIDGIPKAGVVHHPYIENGSKMGMTLFGTQEHGLFKLEFNPDSSLADLSKRTPEYIEPIAFEPSVPDDHTFKLACSLYHYDEVMDQTYRDI